MIYLGKGYEWMSKTIYDTYTLETFPLYDNMGLTKMFVLDQMNKTICSFY